MTRPTVFDLNSDKYNQALPYSSFMVKLDKCKRSCNTLDDPSGRICEANKTEDFSMIKEKINESKTLAKHISCRKM